jgi:hypothetical protein
MPLIVPPAPAQSTEALRAALPSMLNRPAMMKVAPKLALTLADSTAVASLSPALSYRVYALGLTDLASAASNGLRAASLSAWRHTLASDGEIVTADVSVDHAGANHTFAALSANPTAPGVQAEIHTLSQDPDVAKASYEASLLQVPALGVRAVWLHDASGKAADLLVPVAPVRSELTAGRKYTVAEFTAALKDAAAKILANNDPRKGS